MLVCHWSKELLAVQEELSAWECAQNTLLHKLHITASNTARLSYLWLIVGGFSTKSLEKLIMTIMESLRFWGAGGNKCVPSRGGLDQEMSEDQCPNCTGELGLSSWRGFLLILPSLFFSSFCPCSLLEVHLLLFLRLLLWDQDPINSLESSNVDPVYHKCYTQLCRVSQKTNVLLTYPENLLQLSWSVGSNF